MKNFVRLVESHRDGIIAWQHSQINNGLLEGTNSLIQAAKHRAHGYRSTTKIILTLPHRRQAHTTQINTI